MTVAIADWAPLGVGVGGSALCKSRGRSAGEHKKVVVTHPTYPTCTPEPAWHQVGALQMALRHNIVLRPQLTE